MRNSPYGMMGGGDGNTGGGDGNTGGGDGNTGGGDGNTGGGDGNTGGGDGNTGGGDGNTGGGDGNTGGGDGNTGGGYGAQLYAARSIGANGPGVIAERRLRFRIQLQEQSQWCWAAVALSVERYFNPVSKLNQCNVVNRVRPDYPGDGHDCTGGCDDCKCCCDPESDYCNQPDSLEDALRKVFKWRNTLDIALRFDEVRREIDAGRPVGVGITWSSGNSGPMPRLGTPVKGHFVVIRGYRLLSSGVRQLYVADPLNPSSLVDFDEFTFSYYGDGKWTETDLVEADWA
jgi:hypothetical protein